MKYRTMIVAMLMLSVLGTNGASAGPCEISAPAGDGRLEEHIQEACNETIPPLPVRDDVYAHAYAGTACNPTYDNYPNQDKVIRYHLDGWSSASIWTAHEVLAGTYATRAKVQSSDMYGASVNNDEYTGHWAAGWHGSVSNSARVSWSPDSLSSSGHFMTAEGEAAVSVYVSSAGPDFDQDYVNAPLTGC